MTMKEIVLITGANGMVAKKLSQILEKKYTLRFLTRTKRAENHFEWDIEKKYIDDKAVQNVSHVIHLAGAGVADKKWTAQRKEEIISSRVASAELILESLKKQDLKVKSFISASGIAYYGTETTNTIYKENSPLGEGFLSHVCELWESVADKFEKSGVAQRVIKFRIGVVVAKDSEAIKKTVQPINFHLGTVLGSGNQFMPWIHLDDLVQLFVFAIENQEIKGAYNAVAPEHISNEEFTFAIAKALKKTVVPFFVPSFLLKIAFGELSQMILEGSRASSEKIKNAGFVFSYSNLEMALNNIFEE
jgi:uncharacterized protein (TIGR01777 family)